MTTPTAYNSIPYSTTRDDRMMKALTPEIIGLDQRSLAALIAEIRAIAKDIDFIDETAQDLGSWQEFLDEDVLFFLVQLQEFSIQQTQEFPIETLNSYALHLIQTIDTWYKKASHLNITTIAFELENAINHQLKNILATIAKDNSISLHKIWKTTISESEPVTEKVLQKSIATISNTIRYLQEISKEVFENYVITHNISKPHTALILSFLKLYKHIQTQFNGLTKKHLAHYYQEVLVQSKKTEEPEQTQVFFTLANEAETTLIADKTLLIGGMEEDGTEILFETMGDLYISKTILTDLITIYVASNSRISPQNKTGMITGIYQNTLPSALELNPQNAPCHLFGQDGFGETETTTITHSDIGWAVSGPIFMLQEGIRKVTLTFTIDEESIASFKQQLQELVTQSQTEEKVWIHRFFNQAFQLCLTTTNGWYIVPQYFSTIKTKEDNYQLVISFSLPMDVAAVVPYNQEIHEGEYTTQWPVVKIMLDKHKVYYPYSFLRMVKITAIHTKVEVQDLQEVSIYDDYGQQDTSKPFHLFGPQPGKAAACYIGHDEWRYKKLTKVDFHIKWHQISEVNFPALYKQYPEKITENSFKMGISSLSNRQWKTINESQNELQLFHKKNTSIADETSITIINTALLKMVPDFDSQKETTFKDAKNGYFRWQLTAPSFGFGHELYPRLVNEKVMQIAKNPKEARKKNIQIPQTPFAPQVQYLNTSYTAEQEFILHAVDGKRSDKRFPFELFHIHPFGLLSVATQDYVKTSALLPHFEDKGYLFIGLKNATPLEELSFYATIENPKTTTKESFQIRWEYLVGMHWKEVSSTFMLYDGTDNFQHSGNIRIQLPKHLVHQHPLFDSEKAWLRLSIPNTVNAQIGKIVSIQLNGVTAIRVLNKNDSTHTTITESNVITSSYNSIAVLKGIIQPFVPTGGVVVENEADFYTRVSERLFHKKRAVLPSDFEVLILEAFPQVYQASCFPSTLYPEAVPPGTIHIMALPFIYKDTPLGERKFNGYTLQKMKAYLKEISIHHKMLKITNPFYETIRVSCSVVFQEGYETGTALQTLIGAINEFIAPWILQREQKETIPQSEGKQILHPSSLLSHLLAIPSVAFIGKLSLTQIHEFETGEGFVFRETTGTVNEIGLQPTKPWSVFVPSTQHAIDVVTTAAHLAITPLSIGNMEIENDFILRKNIQ